jgi:hypothetical protein
VVATVDVTSLASLDATVQLQATARTSTGAAVSATTFSWTSSALGVLTVSTSGLATAVANGTAILTATADRTTGTSVSGNVTVTVSQVGASLTFVTEPSSVAVTIVLDPGVEVELRDANGNAVLDSSAQVSLEIGDNPTGGTLSGTTLISLSAGVVTFSDLTISKRGYDYTLEATAGGRVAESNPFDVGFNTDTTGFDVTSFTINGGESDAVVAGDGTLEVAISQQVWNNVNCATCIT